METMETVNIVIAAGAIVFVGSVWEWQGTTAAWAAAGLCTLLVGFDLFGHVHSGRLAARSKGVAGMMPWVKDTRPLRPRRCSVCNTERVTAHQRRPLLFNGPARGRPASAFVSC